MRITGYLRTSLLEWPGKISAVVFVSGCNLRCPFCHNRDLVLHPEKLPEVAEEDVLADLKARKRWIDGIVVTGGAPSLEPDLVAFLAKIKDLGFLTMVETNGTRPEILEKLLKGGLVDRLTLDIKAELVPESYRRASGIKTDLEAIKKSTALLLSSGLDFEFRTTVVPGIHAREDLVRLAKQLKAMVRQFSTAGFSPRWFLQQFRPENCLDPAFEKTRPYDPQVLEKILIAVKKHFPQTELRGV